jgi:hypothetical protein
MQGTTLLVLEERLTVMVSRSKAKSDGHEEPVHLNQNAPQLFIALKVSFKRRVISTGARLFWRAEWRDQQFGPCAVGNAM